MNNQSVETEDKFEKYKRASAFMQKLGIPFITHTNGVCGPYSDGFVDLIQLYSILSNEDKVRELISKLKLKSFW
jgi:hypothetical protein